MSNRNPNQRGIKPPLIEVSLYRSVTVSKIPLSSLPRIISLECRNQLTVTARLVQGPLGHTLVVLTNVFDGMSNRNPNQWGIKPPLIEVSHLN